MPPNPSAETFSPLFPSSRVCKVVLLSSLIVRCHRSQIRSRSFSQGGIFGGAGPFAVNRVSSAAVEHFARVPAAEDAHAGRLLNADLARYDLNPELPQFGFPVLVGTGRHDLNVAPAVAYRTHKAIPGSRFVVFEKSGHTPRRTGGSRFTSCGG